MSIATKRGDAGQTDLVGKIRVSKSELRVECYGTIDELGAALGFARSVCDDTEVRELCKDVQRELFKIGSAVATPPESKVAPPEIDAGMAARLDAEVRRIEALPGIVGDWTLPGELPAGAALDVARAVCRRAERTAVRLRESGASLEPNVLVYLNRLSDLLWLLGRLVEVRAGVDSRLRPKDRPGKPWSRAW
ncbi:MAG: cob(I)yrinic acid a,c-diamide adenosyltransferase [Acidobacteria bacterium]|nr:MAG: cob(I)yrinic acid a,c-diamide adenosyltransferase [Acidobacteriota bacterium]